MVGYRYYDAKDMQILFPFGHGLSYTEFVYSDLKVSAKKMKDTDILQVRVKVTNIGNMAGKEVVQLYVSPKDSHLVRTIKELRAFEKIKLEPGECREVTFLLEKRAFAYWNTVLHDWHVESGHYELLIGKSSREIEVQEIMSVFGQTGDGLLFQNQMSDMSTDENASVGASNPELIQAMMQYLPIQSLVGFRGWKRKRWKG